MKKNLFGCAVALLAVFASAGASALSTSYSGNLEGDDDVQFFTFSVPEPSTVVLRTWSFAGGTNAAGTLIADGGFDPILSLFDGNGVFIVANDDDEDFSAVDLASGEQFDSYISSDLVAGNYTVSITQYANFAVGPNLSDGFEGSGETSFGGRDDHFAFDVLVSSVPEPQSGALLALGLGVFAFVRQRRAMR